jgi:hypothetical protein
MTLGGASYACCQASCGSPQDGGGRVAKPDSTRAAIVAAIRAAGGTWVDHEGRKGEPDGIWAFAGRMGWAELKVPGKESGVCGCKATDADRCAATGGRHVVGEPCSCKGHLGTGNAERTTWHAQLAWREAWQGPPVQVWTSVEQALREIGATVA